jgi:AraC-like DNA-binding protein
MKARFEKVVLSGASFLVSERVVQELPMYWHYHPEIQLTLMVEGQGQRLVGDGIAEYGCGDLVLLGPNVPHTWRSDPTSSMRHPFHHAVDIQFRDNFLAEHFIGFNEMRPVVELLELSAQGLAFGHTNGGRIAAQKMMRLPSLSPSRRFVSILNILLDLAMEPDGRALTINRSRLSFRIEDQKRIGVICSYLTGHYEQEVDYRMVARLVHMDLASVCRFFKRSTGKTMTEYVNELRVAAASKMLAETDLSVLEIGFNVGFGNHSNFNRQFKRIKGISPRRLRREFFPKRRPLHDLAWFEEG